MILVVDVLVVTLGLCIHRTDPSGALAFGSNGSNCADLANMLLSCGLHSTGPKEVGY